jgi:exopolysaccharide production protein ExoY
MRNAVLSARKNIELQDDHDDRAPESPSFLDYAMTLGTTNGAPSASALTVIPNIALYRPGATQALGGLPKRILDVVLSAVALFLLAPLLVVIVGLIWLTAGRPIFFAHTRVGRNGRPFRCLKFCTMMPNADEVLARYLAGNAEAQNEWKATRKLANDPRVTAFGKLLRKSSLDELPQLINVIRGDMSCVGPRPVVENELDHYGSVKAEYLSARPGMTGLWQVSGRSSLSYETRVALDGRYVRNWSLWADAKILVQTIPAMMRLEEAS